MPPLCWRNGFHCADKRRNELIRRLLRSPIVDDRVHGDVLRNRNRSRQAFCHVLLGFAASRGEALGQNVRRRGDLDDPCGVAFSGLGDDAARYIRNDSPAPQQIIGNIGRNTVTQPMGLPLQSERPGGEDACGHRLVVFATGFGGTGNDAADETNPLIMGKRRTGHIEKRVFAGTAGSDNENKHIEPH